MFRSFDDMTDFPYAGSIQHEKEIIESFMSMPLDYLRQNYRIMRRSTALWVY